MKSSSTDMEGSFTLLTKGILILSFIFISTLARAQTFSLSGQLMDTLRHPLPAATVMLLNPGDSTLVNFSIADNHGRFLVKKLTTKTYILKVTFTGYHSLERLIHAPEGADILDLGTIEMQPALTELEAVEIAAQRAPVTVKKDTIEFNAGSFKTQENAMVEDLLKKLPGIEVDNEGNITSQGEQVKNVTVDGKKFFGNDPKIASKNLPADAVDKVQVFDKLSDQSAFTGIDDGQREKTINLELKEEKRNAVFGNMMAGAGTDDRLQARASLNKFSKGRQLSFLGMGNNINQSGFGTDDYMNFTGNSRQMMGGGARLSINSNDTGGVPQSLGNSANGVMNTYAAGVNVNHEFNKKTEINGSYFYNYLNHDVDQTTFRENFLQDGTFTFNEQKLENNTNSNHRANIRLDHKIDSANVLRFTGSLTHNQTNLEQTSRSENHGSDGTFANATERQYFSAGDNTSFNANLLYRHKFEKKGRSVSATMVLGVRENESSGLLNAENTFFQDDTGETLQQTNAQSTDNLTYSATVSYTEPLGNRKYLEANYNFRQNLSDVTRDVFDIAAAGAVFDESLSNRYNSNYQYHRAGLNFRIAATDYDFVAGAGFQESNLAGTLELQDTETARTFSNILPSLRFHYSFTNTKHLRFDYETSVGEPDIQQLQPVVDNSDPLNLYVGNPDLRPSYFQSLRLNFTSFNPVNFMNFFAFTNIDYTSNAIVNAQDIDEHFIRTITPVNVSSNISMRTNINVGIPVKKWGSRFNVSANFRIVNSVSVLNEQENDIFQQTAGGTLRYVYQFKEILDITVSTALNQQLIRYDFGQPDQTFVNQTHSAEFHASCLKNYAFNANFDFLTYENNSAAFYQEILLLNLSVSRFVLKNKSGELKLAVTNLLDNALGVDQRADINYLERVTTNSLGRYFMASFIYALNKQINPMSMRRGGPMIRIAH